MPTPIHFTFERRNSSYIFAALGEELECWETANFDLLYFIGCGIHLGNNNISIVLVLLTQLIPDWGKLLTVSTPRGI